VWRTEKLCETEKKVLKTRTSGEKSADVKSIYYFVGVGRQEVVKSMGRIKGYLEGVKFSI